MGKWQNWDSSHTIERILRIHYVIYVDNCIVSFPAHWTIFGHPTCCNGMAETPKAEHSWLLQEARATSGPLILGAWIVVAGGLTQLSPFPSLPSPSLSFDHQYPLTCQISTHLTILFFLSGYFRGRSQAQREG